MGKITLKIPDKLDDHIDEFLVYNNLEIRDKSRIILFAIEQMIAKGEMPDEFKARCVAVKEEIRRKQRTRHKEMQP